ncbi:MAG: membrane protein insertase YidC [Candidatus Staskawiczbacteria bacterium]|nr:membrane protein insertase YidC [Candidatus Staskawiczbacteria bacterium]
MFGFIVNIYDVLLYNPLFNLLVLIYNYLPGHDFGLAVILLTIIIRLIIYPLSAKALNSQRALQTLQPQLQEIQKKYKDDKEKQAKETMGLYKKEKINPFSGLFLALAQLPILIALYRVFWNGLKPQAFSNLYSFMANPMHFNAMFLNMMDLSKPNLVFAIVAGILQFFQTKMLMPTPVEGQPKSTDISSIMQKQMVYFFPFITVIILLRLPSALGLYLIISGLFSIVQQYLAFKKPKTQ